MYQVKMTYRVNDEEKIFEHDAIDCYIVRSELQNHLRLTITIDALYQYETLDVNTTDVKEIVIMQDNQVLYHSTNWNKILNTNGYFPENGPSQCDVEFAHV